MENSGSPAPDHRSADDADGGPHWAISAGAKEYPADMCWDPTHVERGPGAASDTLKRKRGPVVLGSWQRQYRRYLHARRQNLPQFVSRHSPLPATSFRFNRSHLAHDMLSYWRALRMQRAARLMGECSSLRASTGRKRSEEHTSELQSRQYLVCRLL